jgi:hypothetical protein
MVGAALVVALSGTGCSPSSQTSIDAGQPPDAIPSDARDPFDAARSPDAGELVDAEPSADAGESTDGAEPSLACLDADGDGAIRDPFLCDGSSDPPDCDDNDARRSPFFAEIPYDGIDNNCDGTDLVDMDQDGFPGMLRTAWTPQHDGLEWPEDLEDEWDCDDEDPLRHPTALEIIGDGIDRDCDGSPDTAPFAFGGHTWIDPRPPRLEATPESYVLSMVGDELHDPHGERHLDHALGAFFTLDRPQPPMRFTGEFQFVHGSYEWTSLSDEHALGRGVAVIHSAEASGTTLLHGTSAAISGAPGSTELRLQRFVSDETGDFAPVGPTWTSGEDDHAPTTLAYNAFDGWIDEAGHYWLMGCGEEAVHYLRADPDTLEPVAHGHAVGGADGRGGYACFLEPREGDVPLAHVFWDDGGEPAHAAWRLPATGSPATLAVEHGPFPWDGIRARTASRRADFVILAGSAASASAITYGDGVTQEVVPLGGTVVAADGHRAGDAVYLAAIVESGPGHAVTLLRPDERSRGMGRARALPTIDAEHPAARR